MRVNSVVLSLAFVAALVIIVGGLPGCGDNGNGPTNDSPAITSLDASADTVDPTARVTIACSASDGDGDSLSYTWGQEAGSIAGSGASITWTAPGAVGTYSVWVKVSDGKGGEAADTTEVSVTDGFFLVRTGDGLMAVTLSGATTLFYDTNGEVEVLGDRIFIGPSGSILELDQDGNMVGTITRSAQIPGATTFVVLPDAGFAFVSNSKDSIYFMNATGGFVTAGPIPTPSPDGAQGTKGRTVGDRLIMVDSQPDQVFTYDLTTHEGSVLRDLSAQGNPFDIDYSEGIFYVANWSNIYKFTETGNVETVCAVPTNNIVGLAVVGSYAYAVTNSGGAMYKVNIYTGQFDTLVDDLNYPQDIEFVRLGP